MGSVSSPETVYFVGDVKLTHVSRRWSRVDWADGVPHGRILLRQCRQVSITELSNYYQESNEVPQYLVLSMRSHRK